MRRLSAVLVLALGASLGPSAVTADHGATTIEWSGLLPAQPGDGPGGRDGSACGALGLRCLHEVERRLADLEERLGCDHRAVFATTYKLLTRELRREIERRPERFDDPAGVGLLAVAFHDMYAAAMASHAAGAPLPRAWEVAFEAAAHGDHNAGQDMLLAISAHVQRDMPLAIAAVGIRTPDGRSRKPDHDAVNQVLSRAYDVIVPEIARRYDPFMARADASPSPLDDVGAQQLVAGWREHVWRNAERLSAGGVERALAERWLGRNAAAWADGMAAVTQPGYRTVRDAHCAHALDGA